MAETQAAASQGQRKEERLAGEGGDDRQARLEFHNIEEVGNIWLARYLPE